jgi:hypothetical protein
MTAAGEQGGEMPSDGQFVTVSGTDDLPDLAVGRLVVADSAAASQAVARTMAYEQQPADLWQLMAAFVADDGPAEAPAGESYAELAARVAQALPTDFLVDQHDLAESGEPSPDTIRDDIRNATGAGRCLLCYVGQAQRTNWADEDVWDVGDIASMANSLLPIALELSAATGDFAWPDEASMAEAFTARSSGGAVASWASAAGYVGVDQAVAGEAWLQGVFRDRMRGGTATVAAKLAVFAADPERMDLIRGLNWFGDPVLAVAGTLPRDPVSPTPLGSPSATEPPTMTPTASATSTSTATATESATSTPTDTAAPTAATSATATETSEPTEEPPTATPTVEEPTRTEAPVQLHLWLPALYRSEAP